MTTSGFSVSIKHRSSFVFMKLSLLGFLEDVFSLIGIEVLGELSS